MANSDQILRDGRYLGDNGDVRAELRIDASAGVVSGDLFLVRQAGDGYLASFRTSPEVAVEQVTGSWPATWQSADGTAAAGQITVDPLPGDADAATVRLSYDKAVNGLPVGAPVTVVVRWTGPEFRELGVEIETEEGVRPPEPVQWNGAPIAFRECLQQAGFAVSDVGQPTGIPRQDDGWVWDESNIFSVLDDWMARSAQAPLDAPAWQAHLLLLSHATIKGLYGVMFDVAGGLPRQGCAVFVDAIRAGTDEAEQNRRIIQTIVHELGHAFNLVHRFERTLGRADSTSFMNYDWLYRGGNQVEQFWEQFAYRFDPDELTFLRHGPRASVMPGNAPFHSADYWGAVPGTRPAFVPAAPTPGFRLALEPPVGGAMLEFGQPVYLQVTLTNRGSEPVALPPGVLDVKAGHLEVLIESGPATSATAAVGADARSFVPIMQRCLIDFTGGWQTLDPGYSLTENVSLTFGSGGFTLSQPGTFRLTPLLSITDDVQDTADTRVIRGETLTVQVAYPRSRRDDEHAAMLLQPSVGAWFALGGSDVFSGARDTLSEIRDERLATSGSSDPIAAAITRSLGLDASRPYLRLEEGEYRSRPADTKVADALLSELVTDEAAMASFDRTTAKRTRALAEAIRSGDGYQPPR
jgi:hypothetical protein